MNVELHAPIAVERVAVFAEVAWLERRPELGLLCRAARDGQGYLSADVIEGVLPGIGKPGVQNIRRWCTYLDLCDKRGSLTDTGRATADSDEAPIPEQGVYEMWLAQHPLFGVRVLHAERLVSRWDERFEDIVDLPLEPERGRIFRSVIEPKKKLVVRAFPSNHGTSGCVRRQSCDRVTLQWNWRMTENERTNHWQLHGTLDTGEKHRQLQHKSERADIDEWSTFAHMARVAMTGLGAWDHADRRMAIQFTEALDDRRVERFLTDQALQDVALVDLGEYQLVQVDDIPIKPATERDAQGWAMSRLLRHIDGQRYITRDAVGETWRDLVANTPLEPLSPVLPAHTDMLRIFTDEPARCFALAAPVDLSPVEIARDSLASMPMTRWPGGRGERP